uniref:Uncharacterized protein n=1 Tax=Caenorhabditis tropicalis TaxID=1561998 RepID=A0A1I7TRJ1_9PELO
MSQSNSSNTTDAPPAQEPAQEPIQEPIQQPAAPPRRVFGPRHPEQVPQEPRNPPPAINRNVMNNYINEAWPVNPYNGFLWEQREIPPPQLDNYNFYYLIRVVYLIRR